MKLTKYSIKDVRQVKKILNHDFHRIDKIYRINPANPENLNKITVQTKLKNTEMSKKETKIVTLQNIKKKMKINYISGLLIILVISLTSCHSDDPVNSIILKDSNVTIWVGQKDSIAILSNNKSLTVQSDDERIATATIKNNTIIINTCEQHGHTILRLKDGSESEITVDVYVQTLFGGWKETETSQYKREVIIDVEDGTIRESIRQQLSELIAKHLHAAYGFDANTQRLEIITSDGKRTYGDFQFGNERLTMSYDGRSESYKVSLLGLRFIQLTQDYTEDFKKKYPNAGVCSVLSNRYLSYISL